MSAIEFSEIAAEFERRVERMIWCTLATVDGRGRARTRIVHPVWNGSVGWLGSRTGTPKLVHIGANPWVSVMYWDTNHEQVTIDAVATVHHDDATRELAWGAFSVPAAPYGFDPASIWTNGATGDGFAAIRLEAQRVSLFGAPPLVWSID